MRGGGRVLQLNKLRGVAEIRVGVFGGFGGGCLAGRGFSIGRGGSPDACKHCRFCFLVYCYCVI